MDCHILILEDEILLVLAMEATLHDAGCDNVTSVGTVASALEEVEQRHPDVAILDLNVNGEKSFPVADALDDAGIPFVIVSGHSRDIVPARHSARPVLAKPYDPAQLLGTLSHMVDGSLPRPPAAARPA